MRVSIIAFSVHAFFAAILASCSGPTGSDTASAAPIAVAAVAPPPLPEGAESEVFERQAALPAVSAPGSVPAPGPAPVFDPDLPIELIWDDLMPEGAQEELEREYAEFYAMLEARYQANASTLIDAAPYSEIEEGSANDVMPQLGTFEAVESLDGKRVRLPGYVVPFDFDPKKRHTSFLLVPYMGACIHTPPPPPNQIVFVSADPSVRIGDIWAAYWIEGILRTEKNVNGVGDAAYTLEMKSLTPYSWD